MTQKHVLVMLNRRFHGDEGSVAIRPRDGEHLASWGVNERENTSMVVVWAIFRNEKGEQRQHNELFHSSVLRRVCEEE